MPLLVKGDDNYPPYEFLNEEKYPSGFNVDLFRAIAKEMGLNATISLGPWNEVRTELENGSIDALTGMYYSPERAQKVQFSNPFIIVSHAIFVRKGSSIKGIEDLKNASIIVQEGDIMHDFALNVTNPSKIIPVRDQIDALILLSSGKYDAALLAKLQATYHIKELNFENIEAVGPPIEPRDYCFAVALGQEELLQKLNEGLAIIKVTGQYNEIYEKWFKNPPQEISIQQIASYLALVLIPAAGIGLLLFLWLWSLKRQVRQKTHELREELKHRKKIESDLRKSEFRNKQLLMAIPDLIFILDKNGTYIDFHAADKSKLAIPADELIGKNIGDIGLNKESHQMVLSVIDKTIENSKMQVFEYELSLPDGMKMFEARMVPFEEERVLTIVRDISKEKEIKRKVADAISQINHIMEILSILNDQIRNPLTIIAILIENFEDEKKETIEKQIQLIDEIIDKLDIGLLESEKVRNYLFKHYDIHESDREDHR